MRTPIRLDDEFCRKRDLLEAFFAREPKFYLTGGAALAGFYLGHRTTLDLDLFTQSVEASEHGRFALGAAAQSLGAACGPGRGRGR